MEPSELGPGIRAVAEEYRLPRGEGVCVFDVSWGRGLSMKLLGLCGLEYPHTRMFGRHISVFLVPVGSEPGNPVTRRALEKLVENVRGVLPRRVATVLWPSDQPVDSALLTVGHSALPYSGFYRQLHQEGVVTDGWFPMVAFWQFSNHERHLGFMRYMDDGESYISAGYRFTLLAVDSSRTAGAYFIDRAPPD